MDSRSNLHAFLGLDGLMQTLAVAASLHQAAGELVDDNHLAIAHHVIAVAFEQHLGLDRLLQVSA